MSTPLYVPLDDRGVVSVDGPEAGPFLQGLISNDIERVTDARGIYAALLTPQGKFLHDFFVLRRGEGYLLDCEGPRVGDLGGRLVAYRLRADIGLADATEDAVTDGPGIGLSLEKRLRIFALGTQIGRLRKSFIQNVVHQIFSCHPFPPQGHMRQEGQNFIRVRQ